MAGIAGENMVFPILDLIEQKLQDFGVGDKDIFLGYPSIQLIRGHPMDEDRLTSAIMRYDSGYIMEVQLTHGSDDETTYPTDMEIPYFDYEYYKYFRLTEVMLLLSKESGSTVATYHIVLNYNSKGLLDSTQATNIE